VQQFASTLILENVNPKSPFTYNQRAFGPFVLSIDELRPFLLNPKLKEGEFVKLIKNMSFKFTKRRDLITDYVQSEDHVSAYTALYLPTNLPKLHFLLSKLSDDVLNDLENRPFLDIGSGPGTFSLGWKLLMEGKGAITAVDQSPVMLDQAKKIMHGLFPDQDFKTAKKLSEKNSESILFFGHSINEMGIDRALDLIMTVDPEYVIWIEPGTSELFLELKKLRSHLLDSYEVLYPCPSSAKCPEEWCHQVLRMSHDPTVERLSQLVSLDRKILPMTAHVYRKNKIGATFPSTLIRYINETKFSFEYETCNPASEINELTVIEIPKRDMSKSLEKTFKNLNVGERLRFDVEKNMGKKVRVKIKE